MQGDQVTNRPGIEQLLARTLPFRSPETLITGVLLAWQDLFAGKGCISLMEWQPEQQQGCVRALMSTGKLCLHKLMNSATLATASAEAAQLLRDSSEPATDDPPATTWLELPIVCEPTIPQTDASDAGLTAPRAPHLKLKPTDWLIGITGPEPDWPPPERDVWLNVTARLLKTAASWEAELHAAKLRSLIEFAAGAGHEINNPLAAISGRTEQLLKAETDLQRRFLLQTIGAQTYRIRDMIGDTMLFANPPALSRTVVNLSELIEAAVQRHLTEFETRELSLWGDREQHLLIFADEIQLQVVVGELLRNALQAVPDGGGIRMDSRRIDWSQQSWVEFCIANNGPPLTPLEQEHCFDPFFAGRQAGRGLGFGLTKCWRIVTSHYGQIQSRLNAQGWTEFVVQLPVAN